jgi:MinD superfamily P-loop ATPase
LKQLTILSGKGGTGKTTITASLVTLTSNPVMADCDVDAPDLHILLHPMVIETQDFQGAGLAVIDTEKCVQCGLCQDACRFEAITDFKVDAMRCEGCGTCVLVCPEKAIQLKERVCGQAFISKTKYGVMAHALLFPGESNSGKLVTLVRQNAQRIAEKANSSLILIDGPPGLGCPVVASVTGVDVGLVVTEPTVSGIHDMKRVLQLLSHFNVLPLVCINKSDINRENTEKITEFCTGRQISIVGEISFDPVVTEAMVSEKPVVEYSPENVVSREIRSMWENVRKYL